MPKIVIQELLDIRSMYVYDCTHITIILVTAHDCKCISGIPITFCFKLKVVSTLQGSSSHYTCTRSTHDEYEKGDQKVLATSYRV